MLILLTLTQVRQGGGESGPDCAEHPALAGPVLRLQGFQRWGRNGCFLISLGFLEALLAEILVELEELRSPPQIIGQIVGVATASLRSFA